MATTLVYQCGAPVQDGDAVLLEDGKSQGTVVGVFETIETAKARGVSGPGVIVDVHPRGIVFLSTDLLTEEPLVLVERGPDESTRSHAQSAFAFAGILALPALWSFFAAVYSALATGEVTVMSYGSDFDDVPWHLGWARFVGPLVLLWGIWLGVMSRAWSRRWWLGAAACACALALLAFSRWFTSLRSAIAFLSFTVFILAAFEIDKRFGRAAAFAFIVAVVATTVWWTTGVGG
jgi:hypothetical protein